LKVALRMDEKPCAETLLIDLLSKKQRRPIVKKLSLRYGV